MQTTIKVCSLIVYFIQESLVFTDSIGVKSEFYVRKNKRITATSYEKVVTHSTVACSAVCQSCKNCTAANYDLGTKTCYLFNNTCFLTKNATGWSYLSRPLSTAVRNFIYISNRTETWDGAKRYCESIGGGLANILTTADHKKVLGILSQVLKTYVWLGGSDREEEGQWVWTNGCRFNDQDFSFWIPGQPNNFDQSQHCLDVYTRDKLWNDMDCEEPHTFMCEYNVA